MKKIISALTISVLIFMSTVPAFAVTAETKSSDFTYSKMPNGSLKITGYKGLDTVISVPQTYNNRKVTVIKSFDIFSKAKVTSIKIYKNIKRIGNTNVSNLTELKTIKVSANNLWYSSVDGVLYNKTKTDLLACPVKGKSVTIPKTVMDISSNAFKNCSNIKSISIPTAVKNIGSYAFYNTGLTKVTLPKNIKSIGNYAFGAYETESKPAYNSSFVISSSKNSVGQAYAESNGLKFNKLMLIQAIAHRGDYIDAIPDTLQALDQAKAKGYKYSEFDIWETYSGDLFVFHDSNLKYQCNVDKSILDINMSNYKKYPLKVNNMTAYMPTVEQLVSKASSYNIQLYLHLKNSSISSNGAKKLYSILKKYNMTNKVRVFSSHQNILPVLKRANLHTGFLFVTFITEKELMNAVDIAYKNKCEFLITNNHAYSLNANVVNYSHEKNIDIGSYNINSVKKAKNLINLNADFYILNKVLSL